MMILYGVEALPSLPLLTGSKSCSPLRDAPEGDGDPTTQFRKDAGVHLTLLEAAADQVARGECLDIIGKWTPKCSPNLNEVREHGMKALDGDSGDESYEYSKVLRVEDILTEFSHSAMY